MANFIFLCNVTTSKFKVLVKGAIKCREESSSEYPADLIAQIMEYTQINPTSERGYGINAKVHAKSRFCLISEPGIIVLSSNTYISATVDKEVNCSLYGPGLIKLNVQ